MTFERKARCKNPKKRCKIRDAAPRRPLLRSCLFKEEDSTLLRSAFSTTWAHRDVVFRHLANFSSGIFNPRCHITLSQTLNRLLSPHTEIQMRILISQPDKKLEMLMICWRQEVYARRWSALLQTHRALPAGCGDTAPQPGHSPCRAAANCSNSIPTHTEGRWEAGKHWSTTRELFITTASESSPAAQPCGDMQSLSQKKKHPTTKNTKQHKRKATQCKRLKVRLTLRLQKANIRQNWHHPMDPAAKSAADSSFQMVHKKSNDSFIVEIIEMVFLWWLRSLIMTILHV